MKVAVEIRLFKYIWAFSLLVGVDAFAYYERINLPVSNCADLFGVTSAEVFVHKEREIKLTPKELVGPLEFLAKDILQSYYLPQILNGNRLSIYPVAYEKFAVYPAPLKGVTEDYHRSYGSNAWAEAREPETKVVQNEPSEEADPKLPVKYLKFKMDYKNDSIIAEWLIGARYERTFYYEPAAGPLAGISIRVKEWYSLPSRSSVPYARSFIIKTVVDESDLFLDRDETLVNLSETIDPTEIDGIAASLAKILLGDRGDNLQRKSVVDTDRLGIPLYFKSSPESEPVNIGFMSLDVFAKASSVEELESAKYASFQEVEIELHPEYQYLLGNREFNETMKKFLRSLAKRYGFGRSTIHKQDVDSYDQILKHLLEI